MLNLQAAVDRIFRENGANGGMLNFFNRLGELDARVHDTVAVFEKRRQVTDAYIAILVDGGPEDGSAVRSIPFGIITSAAKKRNAERSPADYHTGLADFAASAASACPRLSGVPISRKLAGLQ